MLEAGLWVASLLGKIQHEPVFHYGSTPSFTSPQSMRAVPLSLNSNPLKRTPLPAASGIELSSCVLLSTYTSTLLGLLSVQDCAGCVATRSMVSPHRFCCPVASTPRGRAGRVIAFLQLGAPPRQIRFIWDGRCCT